MEGVSFSGLVNSNTILKKKENIYGKEQLKGYLLEIVIEKTN